MAKPSRGARFFFDDGLSPNSRSVSTAGTIAHAARLALHVAHFRGLNDNLPSIDGGHEAKLPVAHLVLSAEFVETTRRGVEVRFSLAGNAHFDELAKWSFNEADLLGRIGSAPGPLPPAETDFPVEVIEHGGLGNSDRHPEQAVEGHAFSFTVTIQPDCGLIHDAGCKWSVEWRE